MFRHRALCTGLLPTFRLVTCDGCFHRSSNVDETEADQRAPDVERAPAQACEVGALGHCLQLAIPRLTPEQVSNRITDGFEYRPRETDDDGYVYDKVANGYGELSTVGYVYEKLAKAQHSWCADTSNATQSSSGVRLSVLGRASLGKNGRAWTQSFKRTLLMKRRAVLKRSCRPSCSQPRCRACGDNLRTIRLAAQSHTMPR